MVIPLIRETDEDSIGITLNAWIQPTYVCARERTSWVIHDSMY